MTADPTRVLYTAAVAAVALLRLHEVAVSRRHAAALRARGGVEYGAEHYPWMVALHAGWLAACPAEVWLCDRPFVPQLGVPMMAMFGLGVWLRWWAIRTLGERWTTRLIVVPGLQPVATGPYRWLRHPNYLGVVLELASLPLIHTAWITALIAGIANAAVLRERIRSEEAAMVRAEPPGPLVG